MRDRYILDLGDRSISRTPVTARPGVILLFFGLVALFLVASNHFRPLGLICAAIVFGAGLLIAGLNRSTLRQRDEVQGRMEALHHAREAADQDVVSSQH
jgi:hypothetical protein